MRQAFWVRCLPIMVIPLVMASKASAGGAYEVPYVAEDATEVLQSALNGTASTIVIPQAAGPWITGPLTLERDDVTVLLEPGVELLAKSGAYTDLYNSRLLTIRGAENTIIRGEGATIRMRNGEDPDYDNGEWRHAIALIAAQGVEISGLTITRAGGDGILVNGNWLDDEDHIPSRNIVIKDCAFDDNRRQGVSVISVDTLLIENCRFENIGATNGTDPMAGVDFEPDKAFESIVGCVVRDCTFVDNRGSLYATGVLMYLGNLGKQAPPVDIMVEGCSFRSAATDGPAIYLVTPNDAGPPTSIVVRDCEIDDVRGVGVFVTSSAAASTIRFERVLLRNTHTDDVLWGGAPIYLDGQQPDIAEYGGIQFVDCSIIDSKPRPFMKAFETRDHIGLPAANARDITGNIEVVNPNSEGWVFDLGAANDEAVDLAVTACTPPAADVTGDGQINLADLNLVLANFGQATSDGDTNNDNQVDLADLNAVLAAFGQACS